MAKRRKKRVASRGSVNNIILKTLVNGDKYGYEIIKEVEEFSDGKIVLKQPSLYSSLGRFEEKGIVSSYWEDSDIGGRRHYYHLTESGHEYYEKEVLKKRDDEDDVTDDDEDENSFPETLDTDDVTFTEASENEIPAFAEFPDMEEKVIIPDHHFYKETPMEESQDQYAEQYVLKKEPSAYHNSPVTISTSSTNVSSFFSDDVKEEKPWEDMANSTKQNNSKIIGTPLSKLRFGRQANSEEENSTPLSNNFIEEQPSIEESITDTAIEQPTVEASLEENGLESLNKISTISEQKKTKIILDKDGIYKLRDADYDPNQARQKTKPTVIDNVIKRTNSSVIYGYSAYTEQNKKEPTPKSNIEITDEERKIKNDNFIQKFNSLSSFKKMEKKEEDLDKNYLQKLDLLKKSYEEAPTQVTQAPTPTNAGPIITKSILDEEDEEEYEDEGYDTYREPQKNNLFEYEEEDAFVDLGDDEIADDEDESDSLVDLEPEKFEVKNENRQYIEEISNYSTPKETLKINRYENKPTAILSDKTYVLINKIKFVFGIIMSLLMVGELLLTQYILKSNGLIVDGDNVLFIVGYSIVGVLALIYILPFIFSQNEHKLNNYKTKYAILFGILTFLVSIILIYCTNALMGFKLSNFEYFATKLIVPAVLVFNFVILPIIYGLLLKSKKFYG